MNIGQAIQAMKKGNRITRPSFIKGGLFLVYMSELNLPPYNTQGTTRKVNDRTAKFIGEDTPLNSKPYIAQGKLNGNWQPGWNPRQEDLLADDWLVTTDELVEINDGLPRYKCHKIVQAVKISSIIYDKDLAREENRDTDGSATILTSEPNRSEFKVDKHYLKKHNPQMEGYYVIYKDGYESWSPAKEFEEGYTQIT